MNDWALCWIYKSNRKSHSIKKNPYIPTNIGGHVDFEASHPNQQVHTTSLSNQQGQQSDPTCLNAMHQNDNTFSRLEDIEQLPDEDDQGNS